MLKRILIFVLLIGSCFSAIPPELRNLSYGIYPSSPDYNTARFNYNKRFNVFPKAIFAPETESELQYVFNNLKKYRLDFSVRSAGHCSEPGSLSSHYVIDLGNFNQIVPDVAHSEVYIGAGCRLGDVINTLGALDYAIPTGTCPTVGVTGLTLGGGIGLLLRQYGLTCDSVKSIVLLNAEGQVITVSHETYPDLFWALLGGGNGSYGIVIGLTFEMHYIPEVTFYELIWEFETAMIGPVMETWQAWVKTLPSTISSVLGIRHPREMAAVPETTPPLVIRVFGLKVGPEPFTEWKSAFQELHPKVLIFKGSYLDMSKYWASEPKEHFNKTKSRILMQPVSSDVIKNVTSFFESIEHTPYLIYFNFESFGGKEREGRTAFFPRNAFGWWYQAYFWDLQSQSSHVIKLCRDFYGSIPSEVSKYSYANIVDYDIGKYYLEAYYGPHAGPLIDIKRKYDPGNIFQWRQSIPLNRAVPGSLVCQ